MTHVGPAPTAAATTAGSSTGNVAFIEWGPVIAGAVFASALSFVLLTFGMAIGLSATSPWSNSGLSTKLVAALAILWTMAQQIGAFMAGGYIAGRLRTRWRDAGQPETEFRDGLHGALVWSVGVVIGAALLLTTAGAAARTGTEVAGKAAAAAAGSTTDPVDTALDALLRPQSVAQAPTQTPAAPPTQGAQTPRARAGQPGDDTRAEISRILASSVARGGLTAENRTYVAQIVAQRTGISQQEAEKRVADAANATKEAADKARKAAVLTGFVTAAGLLISLAAAWWAALKGGQHRDQSVQPTFGFGRPRRHTIAG
jgi:hypothetical protein